MVNLVNVSYKLNIIDKLYLNIFSSLITLLVGDLNIV